MDDSEKKENEIMVENKDDSKIIKESVYEKLEEKGLNTSEQQPPEKEPSEGSS